MACSILPLLRRLTSEPHASIASLLGLQTSSNIQCRESRLVTHNTDWDIEDFVTMYTNVISRKWHRNDVMNDLDFYPPPPLIYVWHILVEYDIHIHDWERNTWGYTAHGVIEIGERATALIKLLLWYVRKTERKETLYKEQNKHTGTFIFIENWLFF
jgi:hypothetical protein